MLGCSKLKEISAQLCRIKGSSLPFGGLVVLYGGDFNQLPPVGDRCLYEEPTFYTVDPTSSLIPLSNVQKKQRDGFELWKEVASRTIILTHNYRTTDPSLRNVLEHIRVGAVTKEDLVLLRRRVIGHCTNPTVAAEKWCSAILITPRNIVRQAWNNQACIRHLTTRKRSIFISPSFDEELSVTSFDEVIWEVDAKTEMLATWNTLCIDGPVLVTNNVAVELGFANGTQAIIKEVVPDAGENLEGNLTGEPQIIMLRRPPVCVWVEPVNCTHQQSTAVFASSQRVFHPLPEGKTWFPIFPIKIKVKSSASSTIIGTNKSFTRTQIPLTPSTIPSILLNYGD